MRKTLSVVVALALALSVISFAACTAKKEDPIVGTWAMVDNPGKTVKIYKEGEQFIYEGSQGKTQANRVDENTLVIPMGPIEVKAALDPQSGILTVSFMGEMYKYKKTS